MEETRDELNVGPKIVAGSNFPIQGKPFQADYEQILTRKSTNEVVRHWGSLARDSVGRMREDHFWRDPENSSTAMHVTTIWDPVTQTYYGIDSETNQVQKVEIGQIMQQRRAGELGELKTQATPSECPLPTSSPPLPTPRRERIPAERLIEGVLCHGDLYTYESGDKRIEHWFSERLFHAVLETTAEKDVETVYKLFNIRLTEPDPSLFAPRPDPKKEINLTGSQPNR